MPLTIAEEVLVKALVAAILKELRAEASPPTESKSPEAA
jgi:hypothetical protein